MSTVFGEQEQRLIENVLTNGALLTVRAIVRIRTIYAIARLNRLPEIVEEFNDSTEWNRRRPTHASLTTTSLSGRARPCAISPSSFSMSAMISSGGRCSTSSCTISLYRFSDRS